MRKFILLYILSVSVNSYAQQFLSNEYNNKNYKADPFIWDAKEDNYGRIWFANSDGVIRFDGNNWTTFKTPNPARHIAFSKSGDLYIACLGDFGILEFKQDGTTEYVSLFNQDSFADKKTGGNENVFIAGDDIYFYMRNHLVNIKKTAKEYTTLILPDMGEYAGAFSDGKYLYVNSVRKGLGIIQKGYFNPYKNAKDLSQYDLVGGTTTLNGLTIITNFDGLFNFKDNLSAAPNNALTAFAKKGTTAFCILKNQQYVIGTLHDGVKIFSPNGTETHTLQLPSNEIYSVYPDADGNLWVGHAKGLSHILLNSPIRSFPNIEVKGYVTDMHLQGRKLYIATTGGLYITDADHPNAATRIAGIDECWDLYVENGVILAATSYALYQIQGNIAKPLLTKEIFTNIQKGNRTGTIYAFASTGCHKYIITGNEIKAAGKLNNLNQHATSIYENPDGSAWIGTYYSGLIKYPEMKTADNTDLKSGKIFIKIKDGKPLFQSKNNIYIIDGTGFKKDEQLSQIYGGAENKSNILSDNIWIYTKERLKHIVNNKPEEHSAAYSISGKPTAVCEDGRSIWIALEEKIYRVNSEQPSNRKVKASISMVKYGIAQIAYSGIYFDVEGNQIAEQSTIPKIAYENNSIRIEFAINSFINPEGNSYRYKIDGLTSNWSEWQKESYLELKGLSGGVYTLYLQGRDAEGNISDESTYQFKISPPWYLSWWAIIIYIFILFILIYIFIKIYNKRLMAANEKLEQLIKDRTAELSRSFETLTNTQEQLVQSEKLAALGQMTAGIAHEIQNPLNFVTNFSKISQSLITDLNESTDEEERKELSEDLINNLRKINEHGLRASSIVKNMLEHSRKGSGEKQPISINELCNEYIKLAFQSARANFPEFQCEISQNLDSKIPPINVVQQDISRVLLNLLNNALYAVGEKQKDAGSSYKPFVSISSELIGKNVIIKVRDNGMGIPKKTREKIFEPFYSTKPSGSGTGLGLSLSYDIIKAHNGTIMVESEEGKYTEFIVTLPV